MKGMETRGNEYKLNQNHCKYDFRMHFFTNGAIANWNDLPGYAVQANSTNIFKNRLNKHLCLQDTM